MEYAEILDLATAATREASLDGLTWGLRDYLARTPDATVQFGSLAAAGFLDVWRFRFDCYRELQDSWRGWVDFFDTLERQSGDVGVVFVRGPVVEQMRFIVVLSAENDRILTCLARNT
ncbi:hypothetical protein [Actinoplanes sp. G11-F43]|uniref:hypothetical protein n=1 Tax=Actinoplanes sp. G11-F43 TaxID=3424130 RepID=UPI003D33A1CD